jgi:hypothetical protein
MSSAKACTIAMSRAISARARSSSRGELRTAADFANASLVMQHSARFSGYQTAHELAVCAMLLGDRGTGRWLIAATYDRMLGSVGHEQRFGTQYSGGPGQPATMQPVDTAGICDAQRTALGCPTLEQAKNRTLGGNRAAREAAAKLVTEFSGPNRTVRDPKYGLTATYPEGWKIREVLRWGDQQNTNRLRGRQRLGVESPVFTIAFRREPRPMAPEVMTEFVREEMQKKEASRRGGLRRLQKPPRQLPRVHDWRVSGVQLAGRFHVGQRDKWGGIFRAVSNSARRRLIFPAGSRRTYRGAAARRGSVDGDVKMPLPEGAPFNFGFDTGASFAVFGARHGKPSWCCYPPNANQGAGADHPDSV